MRAVSSDTSSTCSTTASAPDATTTTLDEPADDLVTTEHTLRVVDPTDPSAGERDLRYRARSGRLVVRREVTGDKGFEGHTAVAEMAVTSYEVLGEDGEPDLHRPVTFVFNGGPGASSVWLHLGLLGPKRVVMGDAGALAPPPYGLVDNVETLLTTSDLVFVDPVSTGYSRAVEGGTAASEAELEQRGANSSLIHIDWMIGSGEIDVDGVLPGGGTEPVMRAGEWV